MTRAAITIGRTASGDFAAHMEGCKDLTNPRHMSRDISQAGGAQQTYAAPTLAEAIRLCDKDWAENFGMTYPVSPDESGEVWSIAFGSIQPAPCLATAIKAAGITFDGQVPSQPKPEPVEGRKMMVRTIVMVEVDLDAYAGWFDEPNPSAKDVREYVKGNVVSAAESAFGGIDVFKVTDWS